jgi:hypothetical protein
MLTFFVRLVPETAIRVTRGHTMLTFFVRLVPETAIRVTRGQCYDHNFLQFLSIFGKKFGHFTMPTFFVRLVPQAAIRVTRLGF